ncbi:multicopper oxidase [Colletotrichum navitas]|uniref:Multicopper oxidase n=1 Tax=Colletotrichum navitas TaxID=681940 RepID=A0AAD8PJR9_9PEZI|nr:multicopper oxidase [Colletotrichum navitas]KAK1564125.1 multicopper oxidase [Colletotrichum navitas]
MIPPLWCVLHIWSLARCRWPAVFQPDNTIQLSPDRQPIGFEFHITSGKVDVFGAGTIEAILINGNFVGPTLRPCEDDEVEVLVRNYLQQDTTMHFHGIEQRTTLWSDGVPGLTQRRIHAGASYLYRWAADNAGSFSYHAHSQGQLMDSLYGTIIVDASPEAERPFKLISRDAAEEQNMLVAESLSQPLLMADWSHYKFDDFYCIEMVANYDLACTDAIIVKGMLRHLGEDHGYAPPIQALQGDYDLLPHAAALTFVNVGGLYPLQVSVNNHELHVFVVDRQYIHTVVTNQVYVGNRNRVLVMIKLDQEPARYKVQIANYLLNQILGDFAEMTYGDAGSAPRHQIPKLNYARQPLIDGIRSFKPEQGKPYPERQPARESDQTVKVVLRKPGCPQGAYEWSLSSHKLYNITAEEQDPPILFQRPRNVLDSKLIVFLESHPVHKHRNKVFFLGSRNGRFPWTSVALPAGSFNSYLDMFTTLDIAVRYKVENPRAWLLYCHARGMGIVLMDSADHFPKVPLEYRKSNGFKLT